MLRRSILRLFNTLWPARADRQLDREMAAHLALLEDEFRARGLPPADASAAARRAFGSAAGVLQAREQHRDARAFAWLVDARRDLRYAARALATAPGFTGVAVLTLALGIGSVTIIYSVINNVLFDPLPYPNSDRLVNLLIHDLATGRVRGAFPAAEFLDYQQGTTAFEDVVGTLGTGVMHTDRERTEFLRGVWVTPNFFEFMGLAPLLGRGVVPEDSRPGAPPVVVLRHRAWVAFFGSDPGIVGRTIALDGVARTVVGVMPPRFTWHAADAWIPKPLDPADDPRTSARNFQARLKPGVTAEQAEAQLALVVARRARERPSEYPSRYRIQVANVIEFTVGSFSTVLYTTLGAVGLLLLIACCNVANMLLARATVREREIVVRAALGAGRGRIVRQLLVESLLLGLIGGAAGCVLAYVGLDALVAVLPQGPLPGEVEIALDGAALAFSLALAVVSALLFGIAPALYGARGDLVDGLKSGGKAVAGSRGRLRNALVAGEIALSLVLLLGAGLLMRSFISMARVDLGFDPAGMLVVPLAFGPGSHATPVERHRFYEQALLRFAALPGVEAAAATTAIPPYSPTGKLEIRGQAADAAQSAAVQLCTEDYFKTLGIAIVRGSGLTRLAAGEPARTAVVNQAFVTAFFKDADPVGKTFTITVPTTGATTLEIAGVVADVRNQGLKNPAAPQVYVPGATSRGGAPLILVRTRSSPLELANPMRAAVAGIGRGVAMRPPIGMADLLERGEYAQPRFSLIVLSMFAATGTILVAVGVFSVMAYTVSRQTKEIAVRVALGATRRHVFGVVFRLGAQLLLAGVGVGLAAGLAASRVIESQLWNTSPHDPLTIAAATSLIALVALAACYIPARRAMAVDPMAALRQD